MNKEGEYMKLIDWLYWNIISIIIIYLLYKDGGFLALTISALILIFLVLGFFKTFIFRE